MSLKFYNKLINLELLLFSFLEEEAEAHIRGAVIQAHAPCRLQKQGENYICGPRGPCVFLCGTYLNYSTFKLSSSADTDSFLSMCKSEQNS